MDVLSVLVLLLGVVAVLIRPSCVVSQQVAAANLPPEQDFDRVLALPGQPPVQFKQYAGYITVDTVQENNLFYFFAESSSDQLGIKPLVLWLNGGPGCSSLAYGFGQEIGPYFINPNGTDGLSLNPYAWNTEVNMLWLESPTGVGFSFSKNNATENHAGGDTRTAEDAYNFLIGWLTRFPQYQARDFYITGESYAGHYIPQLAKVIVDNNKAASLKINLKGYMVGNPDIDNYWDSVGDIDYYYSHAMISVETYKALQQSCNFSDVNCCSQQCDDAFNQAYTEIGNIDYYSINTPACLSSAATAGTAGSSTRPADFSRLHRKNPVFSKRAGFDPCSENYAEVYFNRPDVQQAIHANISGEIPYRWTACSNDLLSNWTDQAWSMIPTYHDLIAAGLRIWVCSGDADSVVPVTSTRYSIEAMLLPIETPWYPWYDQQQQVGGRTVKYGGLTFVTVRGAGHQVPLLQPSRFLQMLTTFIQGNPLPGAPFNTKSS
ncbi:unnamed protein product [Sphagnum jensenii]|uniref:Carboxypeptidase n=1 Tax=Sphagnum jensenii TaxID=128206 RepID=A0ABP1BJS7_9BRYO